MEMKITITSKKTISEIYDILSMSLGFGLSLESIDSITLTEKGVILLDKSNNWIGNFAYGKHLTEYFEKKLN